MAQSLADKPSVGIFTSQADSIQCHYGMFGRHGGVSVGPYASCNIAHDIGDQQEAVGENRRIVKQRLPVSSLLAAKQVHGTKIYCLTKPLDGDWELGEADALVSNQTDIGLMIQHADCQAVLLYDPVKLVIANVHCGWRGSVQQILPRVVKVMMVNYGTNPAHLQAVIGPSLGPCCAEFIHYKQELPVEFYRFMVRDNYFDFWRISRYQLMVAGMPKERIKLEQICTCCLDNYFSFRRANRHGNGLTGRNCSIISLKKT